MTNNKSRALLVLTAFLSVTIASGAQEPERVKPERALVPKRISSKIVDLGSVYPISMVAGMATLIELPGPVTGIRTGDPESVHYIRPEKPENEVTIVLHNQNARPTNLILRSGKRKFVFDIVPSRTLHQDVLEVSGSYGGAELDDERAQLIDASDMPPKKGAGK